MNTYRLGAVLVGALFAAFAVRGFHQVDQPSGTVHFIDSARASTLTAGREEKKIMIDQTFSVGSRGTLDVQVPDADVFVETDKTSGAGIQIILTARDMKKAVDYYESMRFKVEQVGDRIQVTADPIRTNVFNGINTGNARILIRASVPVTFDASLKTSDGDISLDRIEGITDIRTSDGDIQTSSLTGPRVSLKTSDGDISGQDIRSDQVTVQTSDGDIKFAGIIGNNISVQTSDGEISITKLNGEARVVTSDGNITIGYFDGRMLTGKTSDGDITIRELNATSSEIHSSDGDIDIGSASGTIQSTVSSGNIHVALRKPSGVHLRSSDGDVVIQAPSNLAAELRLRGEHVRFSDNYPFKGRVKKEQVVGSVNGGGPVIEASSSGGVVTFQPL